MTPKQAERIIKLLEQIEYNLIGILIFTGATVWTGAMIFLFRG